MKRILLVDHTATLGGGEIALLNLVQCFDRSRYMPVVLLFSDGPLRGRLESAGVETHVLPVAAGIIHARKDALGGGTLLRLKDMAAVLRFIPRLAAFIQSQKISLVHTNSLKADLIGGLAGRLSHVPVIWHVRDRIAGDYLPPKVAAAFRLLCRVIPTRVIAISHAVARTLDMDGEGRVSVVHDGTPLPAASVDNVRTAAPVIGLVGRISPWKGQDVFVRAAAIVRTRFHAARFQIIGSVLFGEEKFEEQLHALVDSLQLKAAVEFPGFRADISEVISRLDLLVHASTTGEPFGQVVIEGMAAGKPVVATRGGGIPEIVREGVTGLLVPMGDAPAMAAAICAVLSDRAGAAAMGQAGRERVRESFTIGRTARGVESIYDHVLGGKLPTSVYGSGG